jgi:hypothetical protein
MSTTTEEPDFQARITALQQGLGKAGWTIGRNLLLDVRWSGGDLKRLRRDAAELVALSPDVLVAGVGPTTQTLQQATHTIPIVMAQGIDPVGAGFVRSMARPDGNITGFTQFEFSLSAKWLELLKEVAPRVTRVGVVREVEGQVGIAQWAVIGAAASPLGVELSPINLNISGGTERAVTICSRVNCRCYRLSQYGRNNPAQASHRTHGTIRVTRHLPLSFLCRKRRPDVVWTQTDRRIPPHSRVRRPHSQGREPFRPAGAGADQVRAGDQPEDCEGAQLGNTAVVARPRRRSNRIAMLLPAVHESVVGPKLTS